MTPPDAKEESLFMKRYGLHPWARGGLSILTTWVIFRLLWLRFNSPTWRECDISGLVEAIDRSSDSEFGPSRTSATSECDRKAGKRTCQRLSTEPVYDGVDVPLGIECQSGDVEHH